MGRKTKRRRNVGTVVRRTIEQLQKSTVVKVRRLNALKQTKEQEMLRCVGPVCMLAYRTLEMEVAQIERTIARLEARSDKQYELMAKLDQMEKKVRGNRRPFDRKKRMPMNVRLVPRATAAPVSLMLAAAQGADDPRKRAYLKQLEILRSDAVDAKHKRLVRTNNVDTCPVCKVDMAVDKETAIVTCPMCGQTKTFASHIFDAKEAEAAANAKKSRQGRSHMTKFTSQFSCGYTSPPIRDLELARIAYDKVHLHDPEKVQSSQTARLVRSLPISAASKRASDRLTRHLKADSIPEYSPTEISKILNLREQLKNTAGADGKGEAAKQKKSFSNQIYLRQIAQARGMAQGKLHANAKTPKIHTHRTYVMEEECNKFNQMVGPEDRISLYPST